MEEAGLDRIMQVGLGFWGSKTLLSAVELGLFTEIAGKPLSTAEIQGRLGLHPRATRDFLDTLVALGFLKRSGESYSNSASAEAFLDKRKDSYIGGILEMANARLYPFWGSLTTALRTGEPQNEIARGEASPFVQLYADPNRLEQFLRAMTGISRGANLAIAKKFPWDGYRSAVDVGTAQGDLMVQVALAHPHVTGHGFDLPQVRPVFERYVKHNQLEDRVQFVEGNFFEQPIPTADVVMMGHILHDWNLEQKRALIASAYRALPEGGALIAYDSLIDDERSSNAFGLLMSLNMLIETPGGFDYTGAECSEWMREAGFRECWVEHLVGPDSMAVGIK